MKGENKVEKKGKYKGPKRFQMQNGTKIIADPAYRHEIKAIITDFDGTFLDESKEISQQNNRTFYFLANQKKKIVTGGATGRGFHQAVRFANQAGLKYLITDNGGAVFKRQGAYYQLVYFKAMEKDLVAQLYSKIKEIKLAIPSAVYHLSSPENFIIGNEEGEESLRIAHKTFYRGEKEFGEGVIQIDELEGLSKLGLDERIIKICVDFGPNQKAVLAFEEYIKELNESMDEEDRINYFYTSPSKIEIAPSGVDKGEAILFVIRKETLEGNVIRPKNVLAYGDAGNDIPMTKKGFIVRIMSNTSLDMSVLHKSVRITKHSNSNDGVAHNVKKILEQRSKYRWGKFKIQHKEKR